MKFAPRPEILPLERLAYGELLWHENRSAFRAAEQSDLILIAKCDGERFVLSPVVKNLEVATFRDRYLIRPAMAKPALELVSRFGESDVHFVTCTGGPAIVVSLVGPIPRQFVLLEWGATTNAVGPVVLWRAWEIVIPMSNASTFVLFQYPVG